MVRQIYDANCTGYEFIYTLLEKHQGIADLIKKKSSEHFFDIFHFMDSTIMINPNSEVLNFYANNEEKIEEAKKKLEEISGFSLEERED